MTNIALLILRRVIFIPHRVNEEIAE